MLNLKNIQKLKNAATKVFARNAKPATVNAVKNSTQAVQAEKAMLKAERQQGTFDMWQRLGNKGGVPARTVETTVANRGPLNGNLWEYTAAQQAAANAAVEQAAYNSLTKSNLPYWLTLSGMLGGAGTFLTYEATKDGQNQSTNTATSTPVTSIGPSPVTPVSTQKTSNVTEPTVKVTDVPVVSEKKVKVADKPANKTTTVKKPDSKSTTSRATTSAVPSPEDTVVRRPVYEETVKVADTPVDATKVYGREGDVRYDYLAPERKVKPGELGRPDDTDINYNGSDWRDSLYRMAVLSQPLWGREKAEPVDYNFPVYKYMPTAIDVSSQLESADQNYALSRYNFANLYPNTGAGMAAGLQAASNRAKQYADIRQWQTNAQNELIGKNAGIYNNWSNEHARILNDVRNKYAQNRATARNINRQNMATALNNYGAMLSDDKKMNIEAQNNQLKANMLKPFIESVYENSDELIPMLAPYTMNRNVKKKSSTR